MRYNAPPKNLLGKINARLNGFEKPLPEKIPETVSGQKGWSIAGVVVGVLLVVTSATAVFVMSRSRTSGVPVQISVRPDHATIELDGQTCVAPDCKFVLKPGEYPVSLRKAGYKDRTVMITVKPGDSTPLNLNAALEPLAVPIADLATGAPNSGMLAVSETEAAKAAQAKIEIRGAMPHTRVRLDGADIGVVPGDGRFLVRVPPGPHTLDLSLDGFSNRTIRRDFTRGEIVSLAGSAVQLEPR